MQPHHSPAGAQACLYTGSICMLHQATTVAQLSCSWCRTSTDSKCTRKHRGRSLWCKPYRSHVHRSHPTCAPGAMWLSSQPASCAACWPPTQYTRSLLLAQGAATRTGCFTTQQLLGVAANNRHTIAAPATHSQLLCSHPITVHSVHVCFALLPPQQVRCAAADAHGLHKGGRCHEHAGGLVAAGP